MDSVSSMGLSFETGGCPDPTCSAGSNFEQSLSCQSALPSLSRHEISARRNFSSDRTQRSSQHLKQEVLFDGRQTLLQVAEEDGAQRSCPDTLRCTIWHDLSDFDCLLAGAVLLAPR